MFLSTHIYIFNITVVQTVNVKKRLNNQYTWPFTQHTWEIDVGTIHFFNLLTNCDRHRTALNTFAKKDMNSN